MLKMSLVFGVITVGIVAGLPALAIANDVPAVTRPVERVVSALNEPGSLLLLGSVLAGLAYIIDGRQGRS